MDTKNEPITALTLRATGQVICTAHPLPSTCLLVARAGGHPWYTILIHTDSEDEFLACLRGLLKHTQSLDDTAKDLQLNDVWTEFDDDNSLDDTAKDPQLNDVKYWLISCSLFQGQVKELDDLVILKKKDRVVADLVRHIKKQHAKESTEQELDND